MIGRCSRLLKLMELTVLLAAYCVPVYTEFVITKKGHGHRGYPCFHFYDSGRTTRTVGTSRAF